MSEKPPAEAEKLSKDSQNLVQRDENGRLKPGSVLNPVGKLPGTKHLSTKLYEALMEVVPGRQDGKTYRDLLTQRVLNDAITKGNTNLINLVYDRVEGKPDQGVNLHVEGEARQSGADIAEIARLVSESLRSKKTGHGDA